LGILQAFHPGFKLTNMQGIVSRYIVVFVALLLSGCDPAQTNQQGGVAQTQTQPSAGYDQSQVIQAQQMHARKVEVTITARVYKILPDDTQGLPHQRFLLLLDNGTTVLVAHDTKLAPRVPINQGDIVQVHGEYIWNEKGGVIHWTHHSPNGRHFGGWIDYMGQRYQ
jgi:translation initiation factor IF-1